MSIRTPFSCRFTDLTAGGQRSTPKGLKPGWLIELRQGLMSCQVGAGSMSTHGQIQPLGGHSCVGCPELKDKECVFFGKSHPAVYLNHV